MLRLITLALMAFAFTVSDAAMNKNTVNKMSTKLKAGKYYLQNAKTGHRLTYEPNHANSWYPKKGKGTLVQIKPHGKHAVMSPGTRENRNKCASAAWTKTNGYGRDFAAALYDCAVIGFNGKKAQAFQGNKRDGEVRKAKQIFWTVKTKKGKNEYKVVSVDHAHDMPLRCFSSQTRRAPWNKKLKLVALEKCNENDRRQHWKLIKA